MNRIVLLCGLLICLFSCSKSSDVPLLDQPTKEGKIHIDNKSEFGGYYGNLDGIHSSILKNRLHELIDDNKVLGYSYGTSETVWTALEKTDEDPNNPNNVILLYTGRSQAKSYKDRGQGDPDSWNREHVWVKSRGFGGDPNKVRGPSTDIHHIRPADRSVNTSRSTKYFDNGGYAHSEAKDCKYDSNSWEPRDAVKGDIARMMFYMAVRYEGDDGYADLELATYVPKGGGTKMGKLSTLLKWHKQDPVDDFERNRNQKIFEIQGNRNPFIDHPEFVEYIW